MSDLTDKRLGEFHLLRKLGSGGMAEVFLAQQTSLQRYVAVKVMKPSLMALSGEDMLKRFRQEAMMAAGLNHPNIVQVYTIGQEGEYHYIAQEFVQGQDLATLLRERGKLDLSSAFHVMKQVAAALKASGQAGIVHRDIKPENLLINKQHEIKVADFGLAQLGESADRLKGVTMGTPLYMSPEQVNGANSIPAPISTASASPATSCSAEKLLSAATHLPKSPFNTSIIHPQDSKKKIPSCPGSSVDLCTA